MRFTICSCDPPKALCWLLDSAIEVGHHEAKGRIEHLSDQSVLRLYEGIRHQVEADRAMGSRYRLVGNAAKERAQRLQAELAQRELKFMPIIWS